MNLKNLLYAHSKYEKIERYIILGIIVGVLILGIGMVSTIFEARGLATAVLLAGSFITFIFTVILVFYWLIRGDR